MRNYRPNGTALLLNVLVMSVIGIVATSVLARGSVDGFLGSAQTLAAWDTRADVLGCIDEAIIQLKHDNDFNATAVYIGSTTCTVSITTPSAGLRTIVASLSEENITRQITAYITLDPFAVTQITEP
jgi:hypothetical protein